MANKSAYNSVTGGLKKKIVDEQFLQPNRLNIQNCTKHDMRNEPIFVGQHCPFQTQG